MDLLFLAIGIAVAGYFIGDGLRNFQNPGATSYSLEKLFEEEEHELIKESDVHSFMGVSKKDAKALLQEYPDVPHITLNQEVYYPKKKLREWLEKIGE
ncbi:DNA-binding protein [Oceanobacillus halotolerans]|uniref:DNA-binding protein n=1 Tax=Oceanobacillus halotolerans TaxID=2663380 RepID=UPI0013DB04F2|nr:DNA-binding protein [Oceanobacillus halotolerans]